MSLYDEIMTGPLAAELAPHVASGNDAAITEILNRKDIDAYGYISNDDFSIWAAKTGQRAVIDDTAANSSDPLRSVALALQDLLRGNLSSGQLNFSRQDNIDMANAWLSLGKMTQEAYDSLFALAATKISRSEQLKISVTHIDVATALRG